MTAVDLKLVLPDELAREAAEVGLLTPESVEALLRAELRRRHVGRLFETMDRLATLPGRPMTEVEVQEEIRAVRAERRRNAADRR